eukprot:m.381349 g.381349  ORF g.381349 m.381349 type:complete len:87 (-) comp110983_c0_seq1:13-273(-)
MVRVCAYTNLDRLRSNTMPFTKHNPFGRRVALENRYRSITMLNATHTKTHTTLTYITLIIVTNRTVLHASRSPNLLQNKRGSNLGH